MFPNILNFGAYRPKTGCTDLSLERGMDKIILCIEWVWLFHSTYFILSQIADILGIW